jgi:hypothetical protein
VLAGAAAGSGRIGRGGRVATGVAAAVAFSGAAGRFSPAGDSAAAGSAAAGSAAGTGGGSAASGGSALGAGGVSGAASLGAGGGLGSGAAAGASPAEGRGRAPAGASKPVSPAKSCHASSTITGVTWRRSATKVASRLASQSRFTRRGMPWVSVAIRSSVAGGNSSGSVQPTRSSRVRTYSATSAGDSVRIRIGSVTRWRSWRRRVSASLASSSGWPASTIWRIFSRAVSRLERSRSSSSTSTPRSCASSIRRATLPPASVCSSRNSFSRWRRASLRPPSVGMPSSVRMCSRISSKLTVGFSSRTVRVLGATVSRRRRRSVVLPVPASPTTEMKPLRASIP